MKVDFSTVLLDLDDKPMKAREGSDDPATLALCASMALQASDPQKPDAPDVKLRCFTLLMSVHKGGVVEISTEDATLLKDKIGAVYPPLIYGRCYDLLK